jgi:NADPH2:quinone reductase
MISDLTCSAAQFSGHGKIAIVRHTVPFPDPGHVRIKIQQCGVCSSNVPPWEGRTWFSYPLPPGAPGHEATGTIVDIAEGCMGSWAIGDRVAYIGERGFAEYENVPVTGLLFLPKELSEDFLGEPLACAINIFRRAAIIPGQTVALIGLGFLGRLLVPLVLGRGARVITVTRRDAPLLSGVTSIQAKEPAEVIEEVTQLTEGKLCDVVVEATGHQQSLDLAAELTCVRGRLVIAGYHQDRRQVNMQLWNWRGLDVINAHERAPAIYLEGMKEAMAAVSDGRWSLKGLVSHRFPLAELSEALRLAAERPPGFTKAVVTL